MEHDLGTRRPTAYFAGAWLLAMAVLLAANPCIAAPHDAETATVVTAEEAAIAVLPVTLHNNRLHIGMTVYGTDVTSLLDTGASSTILFNTGKLSKDRLPLGEEIEVNFPAFQASATGRRLPPTRFKAGDLVFVSDRTLFLESREDITGSGEATFDGILGRDFFNSFIIEIVPSQELMLIYPNGTDIGKRFPMRHQLHIDGGTPYLLHRSRLPWETRRTPKKLLLDTGYPGGIVLWDETHFRQATTAEEREALRAENKGIIYYGIMRFGRLIFKNMPVFISPTVPDQAEDRHGIIGASMFLPFRYAFDFQRKSLWLMPRVRSYGIGFQISNDVIYTPGDEDFIVKDFRPKPDIEPKTTIHRGDPQVPDQ